MKQYIFVIFTLFYYAVGLSSQALADDGSPSVERGRYLVKVGGCNDCHTPAYGERGGQVPESEWLVGVPVGFNGPWGTSYPANLRLLVQHLDESAFVARARSPMLPPMPWFNVVAMSDDDVKSIYRFIVSLGPAGEPAPADVAPGVTPKTAYVDFVPRTAAGTVQVSSN
jgi:mono/diheme cytochrome c family protein